MCACTLLNTYFNIQNIEYFNFVFDVQVVGTLSSANIPYPQTAHKGLHTSKIRVKTK